MAKCVYELQKKKWGVLHHYLSYRFQDANAWQNLQAGVPAWNDCVNMFDTEKLAFTLNKMGAGYYFITLMQGRNYMIAPNATFDRIAGTKPGEACSTRDLPLDLYKSLSKYNIDLCLYFTGDGPHRDTAGKPFGHVFEVNEHVSPEFVDKWSSVLEEYAVRYGDKVKAWWIDGTYRNSLGYTDELINKYYDAVKIGNPECAVTFNDGYTKRFSKNFYLEDYTAGEINYLGPTPQIKRDKQGNIISTEFGDAVPHVLTPLGYKAGGEEWMHYMEPGVRYTADYVIDYINTIYDIGGFVTLDMAVAIDGTFSPEQEAFMTYVGNKLK